MERSPRLETAREALVPAAGQAYIPELDGIRAVAVGIVVSAHYRLLPYMPGGFGVTLFFFLSGYLITTLFYSEYGATRAVDIPRFYLRRWLRLTPSLVISVLLAVIFYRVTRNAAGGQPVPVMTTAAALLYYTNYYDLAWGMDPAKIIPFGICWSLAVEEHFYLVWPWILRRGLPNAHKLFCAIAALCAGVLAWRFIATCALGLPSDHMEFATDTRIDSILYGALLRIAFQTTWAPSLVAFLRARTVRLCALAIIALTFVLRDAAFRDTVRYSLQGMALMSVFTVVLTDDPKALSRRLLSSRPMVLVGQLSYSIYLFHLLARTPGEVFFGTPFGVGPVVSGLVLTGVLSYGLLIGVERPMARLRHRFRAKASVARVLP